MFTVKTNLLGETQLWRAVIEQAIVDFRWEPTEMFNQPLWRSKMNAKTTARWWLCTEDFYEVCTYASLDANDVLQQFKGE